jgi:hypothetical protein
VIAVDPPASLQQVGTPPVLSILSRLASPTDDSQLPLYWAMLALDSVRTNHADAKVAAFHEAERMDVVMDHLGTIASHFRRHGRTEEARRITARMLALANRIVAAYPRESCAYLAISDTYFQMSKDARERDDRASVTAYLKQALGAAQWALVLDPNREGAQHMVNDLQRRLARVQNEG